MLMQNKTETQQYKYWNKNYWYLAIFNKHQRATQTENLFQDKDSLQDLLIMLIEWSGNGFSSHAATKHFIYVHLSYTAPCSLCPST